MAQQANVFQEGVDRINDAFSSIDDEFQRVQKEMSDRRKSVEKRTRKEVKRLRSESKKNSYVKRAESLRKDANKQLESGVDSVLALFQIASKADLSRIDRKLNAISKRLKRIETARKGNGASPAI